MVQDQEGPLARCHALGQQDGVPVGQHMPADGIDAAVVDAFFQALSPPSTARSRLAPWGHSGTPTTRPNTPASRHSTGGAIRPRSPRGQITVAPRTTDG
jgi:hypothetical protein